MVVAAKLTLGSGIGSSSLLHEKKMEVAKINKAESISLFRITFVLDC